METNKKIIRVKKRLEEIKEFYKHILVYIIINVVFSFLCYKFNIIVKIFEGLSITNNISEISIGKYSLWFLWGIILIIDFFRVFGFRKMFGREWESKKVKEFMNQEESKK